LEIVPAGADKTEEAEFIMLRNGGIAFEGHAADLRRSSDPYLRTFLS
jgi:ABC-type transporter Mla maintaining outer membrane lipid asymmetry ATPase subunit MlaF